LAESIGIDVLVETFGAHRAFEISMKMGGVRHYVPKREVNSDEYRSRKRKGGFIYFLTRNELNLLIRDYGGGDIRLPIDRAFCINYLFWVEARNSPEIARAFPSWVCKTRRWAALPSSS
jgi:hypothetical protein